MPQSIYFEIDETPLGLKWSHAPDYIGRVVGAATTEPLLRFDDERADTYPNIFLETHQDLGGLRRCFRVDTGMRWSDGDALTAHDVVRSLDAARARPYWANHLRFIDDVQSRGDIIQLQLRRPARHLLPLLCADALAPTKGNPWQCGAASLGPYNFESLDENISMLRFAPNHFASDASDRPKLEFLVRRDVGGVLDRYMRDETDVTCSTMFPFTELSEWSSRSEFHSKPAPIWMQIEIAAGAHPALLKRNVRLQLSAAIDRPALARALGGGVAARWSTLAITRNSSASSAGVVGSIFQIQNDLKSLRLAYCDYYPNRQVAEFVQRSWRSEFDIEVILVPVSFEGLETAAVDMRLELRYPAFPDPIAELEAPLAFLSRVVPPADLQRVTKLILELNRTTELDIDEALGALVESLDSHAVVMPLLNLRHHWLMKPHVKGFTFPYLGNFDYRSLRHSSN